MRATDCGRFQPCGETLGDCDRHAGATDPEIANIAYTNVDPALPAGRQVGGRREGRYMTPRRCSRRRTAYAHNSQEHERERSQDRCPSHHLVLLLLWKCLALAFFFAWKCLALAFRFTP